MQTISATGTAFYKYVFPAFWFGILGVFLVAALVSGAAAKSLICLAAPLFLGILGYLLMRELVFDLADEVVDAGDHLIVRRSGQEIQVPIGDIVKVSTALRQNPPRVTLHLKGPSELGTDIHFMAIKDSMWNVFAPRCTIAEDLSQRVDAAHRQATTASLKVS